MNTLKKNPRVSIILVNYNGFCDTVECVQSLMKIDYDNFNIVIVDNASTDTVDATELHELETKTDIIRSSNNLGFSGGNNFGIEFARKKYNPKYILLLNNDTVVTRDFLGILVQTAEKRDNVGIVCGKIYWYDNPDELWFGGGIFNRKTGMPDHVGWKQKDTDEIPCVREITYSTGCLQLIPCKVLDSIGFLDDRFFLYAEDTDFSCRVIDNELKIFYCNNAKIYHKVSRSTGNNSRMTQYYMIRNNLYIIKTYSTSKIYALLRYAKKMIRSIMKHELDIGPVVKAYVHFLINRKGKCEKV